MKCLFNASLSGLSLVMLLTSSAFGQDSKLADAATVAKRMNQRVNFQDEVKAVSHSRSRDGCYINFGAPYPNQVLSVWVPDSFRLPRLLGRTVRIDGVVQSSETGPMINLDAPGQIEVLPVDESILSKLQLGGRTDRREFTIAVKQRLRREDIDTIEVLGNELHQSHERFTDGTWIADAYFAAFDLSPTASEKSYEERRKLIAEWKRRYPLSILLVIVEAKFHVDLAWKWRGTDYAAKVPKQNWEPFKSELAEARQILEANPQTQTSSQYFIEMQTIALGQNWKKDEYFKLFSEAIAREPEYYHFYFSAAYYLLPKWHGKKGDWEKFAEEQRQRVGGPAGDALYARIAWARAGDCECDGFFEETAISWETMAAGFEAMMQQYPDSNFNRNAYAHFAWRAKDRDRLRSLLPAVEASPDMEIWVNLENVQLARKFANESGPAR